MIDVPPCAVLILMLWFFDRNDESLNLETTYDNDSRQFVAVVRYPDGREEVERFVDNDAFGKWLASFERTLDGQRWRSRGGGPLVLPYGWPDKAPT
jgi:hypothetical protein